MSVLTMTLYYQDANSSVYLGDCVDVLATKADVSPDLIMTSPPYDNLRDYGGHKFEFEPVADAIVDVMQEGSVLVWVVADATIDGGETGTSFRQALGFVERGLKLHDTMIYRKDGYPVRLPNRYMSEFEYMFVFALGTPSTANLIADRPNLRAGTVHRVRNGQGRKGDLKTSQSDKAILISMHRVRGNIWTYDPGFRKMHPGFPSAHEHPATFPIALAKDHILTWTNPGGLVLDPMAGSGTTLRAAKDLNRSSVGVEVHEPYCALMRERLAQSVLPIADVSSISYNSLQDRRLVRQRARQPQTYEPSHRLDLVEHVLHARVTEVVEQLHAVYPQHRRQLIGSSTSASLRIERSDALF